MSQNVLGGAHRQATVVGASPFHRFVASTPVRDAWFLLAAAGACAITTIEMALMDRRFGVFRGGFLIDLHLATIEQRAAFVAMSLVADLVVVAPVVVGVLWLGRAVRLGRPAAYVLAIAAGVMPLALADVFSYQLLALVGDAFDLSLMFDLVGRNPRELLAVASAHAAAPAAIAVAFVALLCLIAWVVQRVLPGREQLPAVGLRTLGRLCLVIALGATVVTVARLQSETMQSGLRRKPSAQVLAIGVNLLTDVDRDGIGIGYTPADPDPFNAAVRPYAVDIAGNGIDENGIAGDLPVDQAVRQTPQFDRWAWRPDVVLVLLESVRADAVGATLDGQRVTPVLDRLAETGSAASLAFSHNGFTYQSRYHLFTGRLAAGARDSLIDDFKRNGYQVGYFSGQDDSFGGPGLSVGFERADAFADARNDVQRRYTQFRTAGSLAVPSSVVLEHASRFVQTVDRDTPLFLYVNFHDTHFPYHHREIVPIVSRSPLEQAEIVPSRATELRNMYLNTVANVDRAVGALLDDVRAARGREPGVIVTSDHGESLFDEGFLGHGYAMNDAQTRVPFVVSGLPLRIAEPFGHADMRPAMSAMLSSAPNEGLRPTFEPDPGRKTFQYLGSIDRPRQIGLVSSDGKVQYDFRSDRLLLPRSDWRRASRLRPEEQHVFAGLVHRWEALLLPSPSPRWSESWRDN
jgi:hypothetical protein